MSKTLAQLRAQVLRMINETSTTNRIDASGTTNLDAELADAFNKLAIEHKTFLYTKTIPIAEQQNVLNLSSIEPTAVKLGFGTTNNGWTEDIEAVQFQRGESGAITTDDTAGSAVVVASTAHGLAEDDVVYFYNTETYNGRHTVTSVPTVDSFIIVATNSEEVETGTWVKATSYRKQQLYKANWEDVENLFFTPDNPSASDIPQGTLWVTWVCAPGDLPASTAIPDYHFPPGQQGLVADEAAMAIMQNLADALRNEPPPRIAEAKRKLVQQMVPPPPSFFGQYRYEQGMYSYISRTERALIFYPRWL